MQRSIPAKSACLSRSRSRSCRGNSGSFHGRAGVVILEVIVLFPVIVILLASVIEFGLLLSGIKHVQASSRAGAKVASELAVGSLSSGGSTVQTTVDRVLSSGGYSSCQVILEYITSNSNCTGAPGSGTSTAGSCTGCNAPATSLPTIADVPGGSVRVTVCVDADQLTPDLLSTFGFDISSKLITASTTLPYENCPDP